MSRMRVAVVPTIERLLRGVRALHALQAVFVGVAAGAAVQAAAVQVGAAPFSGDGWRAAFGCALLAGWCWWRAHPIDAATLARRIDRELDARGELETAWEAEQRGGPLAPALTRRALRDVEGPELLRAATPGSTVAVLAPLVALAALALCLDVAHPDGERPELAALAEGLAQGLAAARATDGSEDPTDVHSAGARLTRAAKAAADLAERSRRRPERADALVREAGELFDELDRLAREVPLDAAGRRALDAARNAAEALREGAGSGDRAAAGGGSPAGTAEDAEDGGPGIGQGEGPGGVLAGAPGEGAEGAEAEAVGGVRLDLRPADAHLVDAWARRMGKRD
jgi:hypothetical protein